MRILCISLYGLPSPKYRRWADCASSVSERHEGQWAAHSLSPSLLSPFSSPSVIHLRHTSVPIRSDRVRLSLHVAVVPLMIFSDDDEEATPNHSSTLSSHVSVCMSSVPVRCQEASTTGCLLRTRRNLCLQDLVIYTRFVSLDKLSFVITPMSS